MDLFSNSQNESCHDSPMLLYEVAKALIGCRNEVVFCNVIKEKVREFLPHRSLIAVLGRIDLNHLEILDFIGIDHPITVQSIRHISNIRERQALIDWLRSQEPIVLDLPRDAHFVSETERNEIEVNRLGRIAAHGVLNISMREGSYFSFAGIPESWSVEQVKNQIHLLVPHLHQALLYIHRARSLPETGAKALTSLEHELLRWISAGRTNKEIAMLRGRSPATIRNQIASLFSKLGVGSRAEAVRVTRDRFEI